MQDLLRFSRSIRRRARLAGVFFFGGAIMLGLELSMGSYKEGYLAIWIAAIVLGVFLYYRSMDLPLREVMQLAQAHDGLLTVTEISTQLDITPDLAIRSLRHLAARNLARPSLQQVEKNLWEFPDCMKLPITQAIELARESEGRIDIQRLMATGVSLEAAQQTLDLMRARGLVKE